MLHIVRLDSTSRLPAVQSALARARARQVGLLFPPEGNAALADGDGLTMLRRYCEALGKAAVVLGGNAALRAVAVAAGFPAATSLEAWDSEIQPRAPEHAGGVSWDEDDDGGYVRVVRPEPPTDTWSDEPPDFVLRLLARSGAYPGPHDDDTLAMPHRAPATDPLDDLCDDAEALVRDHERHEEHFTSRIRTTGNLGPLPFGVDFAFLRQSSGEPDASDPGAP